MGRTNETLYNWLSSVDERVQTLEGHRSSPSPSRRKLLIVAGSHQHAAAYAKEQRLRPMEWFYAGTPERLHGICKIDFVRIGLWQEHHLASQIMEVIESAKHCDVTEIRPKEELLS